MRRVLLLNALLSAPWTRSYLTPGADDHDDGDGKHSSLPNDRRTGASWARSSGRMQESSGNARSRFGRG
jgi:hypothetical protein